MSEKIIKLPDKVRELSDSLSLLSEGPSFSKAQDSINKIIALLGIEAQGSWKLFSDTQGKIRSNATWFMEAEGFADRRATYKIAEHELSAIDFKAYWMKSVSKSNTSWVVALTPNFEDEPFYGKLNIGIDFVIPEKADRVHIVLSKDYVVRSLELSGALSVTQQEILSKWINPFDFGNKSQVHDVLWNSFDLKPVNQAFYEGVSSFFVELTQYLSSIAKVFDEKHAAYFTNRLIGRLVFCWFLNKKGIVNPDIKYFDQSEKSSTDYYRSKLETLFFKVFNTPVDERSATTDKITPFLNGGLFEVRKDDKCGDSKLTFPADYFDRFITFLKRFNFTTDESTSTFQQIAIDPEMLGRIFENLLAEQIEETGEQARKAKGAFYTPREIVDYICRESLREYLKARIKVTEDRDQRIGQLLDSKPHEFRDQQRNYRRDLQPYKYEILRALDELKVIDPACGSGAFPMGMLQLLLQTYERLDSTFNPYKKKLDIIKHSLYGIDIEPMATEIARLRAWLSVVVDEDVNCGNIEPLPNLDFKFICANSLIGLEKNGQHEFGDDLKLEEKLMDLRDKYYDAKTFIKKQKLRKDYEDLINQKKQGILFNKSKRQLKVESYLPFDSASAASFFDPKFMYGCDGFDIVIGNPPYVSTKGVKDVVKQRLEEFYGFADDLYSHFYFKGLELCKKGGILSYITSKTFWTIQTKKNIRELLLRNNLIAIYDTDNPFESAMVDTAVVLVQKDASQINKVQFLKSDKDYSHPTKQLVDKSIYDNAVNKVIFNPNPVNLVIYGKYNDQVKTLMNKWWSMINTSKNISKYGIQLKQYRDNLKAGDVTLLGLITDGGQGLATANNGKYIGILSTTKEAMKARNARNKKFLEFIEKQKISGYGVSKERNISQLNSSTELELRDFFDSLKDKYGRDIFGQGFLYRIVDPNEVKDVSQMTDDEKVNGIVQGPSFVPYDKGDKDGNRWYLRTPYYINWSRENVKFLKRNSGKKGKGMPVVRSPQFYFRAGFCWSDIHTVLIKTRLKDQSIHDVKSMSLFSFIPKCSNKYLVAILNSSFISNYDFSFVNGTQTFQINDARQIPIIVPNKGQLSEFEHLFDRAYSIKIDQFDGKISEELAEKKLNEIQNELDDKVLHLYGLEPTNNNMLET